MSVQQYLGKRAMIGLGAAVLLLAGCGGDSENAGSAAPSDPLDELLLTEEEFPAGATLMSPDQETIKKTMKETLMGSADAEITPQNCADPIRAMATSLATLIDPAAVAVAGTGKGTYVEMVSPEIASLTEVRATLTQCSETENRVSVDGEEVFATVTYELIKAPAELAEQDSLVYRSTMVVQARGETETITELYGYTMLRDRTILLATGASGDKEIDDAEFLTIFANAVEKVRDAP